MNNEIIRAELGIDGNYAFALLGSDLQSGESEFVEMCPTREEVEDLTLVEKLVYCKRALQELRIKLDKPDLPFFFGNSHPYGKD